jgi:peptide/nickel transport system substrate-binding protein
MTSMRRRMPALVLALLVAGACGNGPTITPGPSGGLASPTPTPLPAATERPFARVAWPAGGSACDLEGYTGRLGRVEAVGVRTVRFTLCGPDGAFPARLAHPALGIVDGTSVDLVGRDPGAAREVPGAGAFRVEAWTGGDNLRLARVAAPDAASATPGPSVTASGTAAPAGPPPVIVLRWEDSSADRTAALRESVVDGIDAPDAADAGELDTLPEISAVARPGLATAYLGFGTGKQLDAAGVRRAFAQALDHAALARDAFPAGSTAATHTTPCDVPAGCAGLPWYEFNGPAASAALDLAKFDRTTAVALHVPDRAIPGMPDPAALAAAIRDQLAASVDVPVEIDPMPPDALAAGIADGSVDGFYLGVVASSLADPSGFLDPLFGEAAAGTVAARRAKGVPPALADAAAITRATEREASFAAVNDAVRASAPIVPLVHPGSVSAYRADVTGVAVSPLGADPLGSFVPGDRRQLVVMSPSEPAATWCAVAGSPESLRLCALVTPGLLGFDGASLVPVPSLASRCTPAQGATVWVCRLQADLTFSDGKAVDAGDVVAFVRAQADAGSPLRDAFPASAFAAWDELFGGPVPRDAP